jgi:hypothetical protein
VFAQLVAPLITEITCLRSHDPELLHLVSAHVGSLPGELRSNPGWRGDREGEGASLAAQVAVLGGMAAIALLLDRSRDGMT